MKRLLNFVGIVACLNLLLSCSPKSENTTDKEEKERPVPVRVMKIKSRDLPLVVESIGRLVPNREVTLSAEVGGVVESYNADIGDRVRSGQTLVSIDPTEYRLALKEAQTNLAIAHVRLETSKKSFKRSKNLLPRDVITPDAFEKSEADFKTCSALVSRAKVLVDIANERLNKTRIKAPFSGLIAARMVEKGQTVGVRQPLMTVVELDPMRVRVYLAERDYVYLDRKDPVSFTIEASPESVFKGRIDRIGIKADERTNTFDVEILLNNPNLSLKAGMTARVWLTTTVIHDVIMIPQSAVLYRKDRKEVFVVGQDQKAEAREVELGRSEGPLVRIVKGLSPGDKLVITGGQYLKPGDKIMIASSEKAGTP